MMRPLYLWIITGLLCKRVSHIRVIWINSEILIFNFNIHLKCFILFHSLQNVHTSGLLIKWFKNADTKITKLSKATFKTNSTKMSESKQLEVVLNVSQLTTNLILYFVLNLISMFILFTELIVMYCIVVR